MRLRRDQRNHRIWVDAICINQQDDAARTYQVGLMRDIYHQSAEVMIWLGEPGYDDAISESILGTEGTDTPTANDGNMDLITWLGDGDMHKLGAYFSPDAEAVRERAFNENTNDIYGAFCILYLLSSGVPVVKIWHLRQPAYSAPIVRGLNAIINKAWVRRNMSRKHCIAALTRFSGLESGLYKKPSWPRWRQSVTARCLPRGSPSHRQLFSMNIVG
jgi:hypothetical protein